MQRTFGVWAALALSALAGCATHNGVTTAHPIGEGNVQVGVEPGLLIGSAAGVGATVPSFNLAVRYGVSDRVDLGGRLGTSVYEILGKVQLNELGADIPISIAPSGNVWFAGANGVNTGWFSYQVPLLIGIPTGEHQIVVGPKVGQVIFMGGGMGSSAGGMLINVGGGVAYSLKLGDNFRFHPELSVTVPAFVVAGASSDGESVGASAGGFGSTAIGITAGLLFGGD